MARTLMFVFQMLPYVTPLDALLRLDCRHATLMFHEDC